MQNMRTMARASQKRPGDEHKLFSMLDEEISFDVDMSKMPCGLNGAIYFAEMDKTGDKSGGNAAGAEYGTGYSLRKTNCGLQVGNTNHGHL